MKTYNASFLGAFIGCVMCGTAMVSAQTTTASPDTTPSMEVRRIGLADLNGVLQAARSRAARCRKRGDEQQSLCCVRQSASDAQAIKDMAKDRHARV